MKITIKTVEGEEVFSSHLGSHMDYFQLGAQIHLGDRSFTILSRQESISKADIVVQEWLEIDYARYRGEVD